jgi:hypothetical protein
LIGYDVLPIHQDDNNIPLSLPQGLLDHLAQHERIELTAEELARIKALLCVLYEAGPGAKTEEVDDPTESNSDGEGSDDAEGTVAGAYIPIPTETFLEELSVKLQIHPISVYWLLEELRAEGVRCLPEERRSLEDRLTVIVLRLLGHRWPKQIEAGQVVPEWVDRDGVIPLTLGTGEATLADRVRSRLRAEEGDLGAQQVEALLQELTGRDLAECCAATSSPATSANSKNAQLPGICAPPHKAANAAARCPLSSAWSTTTPPTATSWRASAPAMSNR